MKLNADLIFGILLIAGTVLSTSLADDTSYDTDDEKRLSEHVYGALKINPREGRLWAPWSYASPSTRGRWNVGNGGSGNGPNVAWDSTMSRHRRNTREGRLWAPWSYASSSTRGRWNVGSRGSRYGPNVAWDSTMSRRRPHRRFNRRYNYNRYY